MFKGGSLCQGSSLVLLGDVFYIPLTWAVPLPSAGHSTSVLHLTVYFRPLLLEALVIGQMTISREAANILNVECHAINLEQHLERRWLLPNVALFSVAIRRFRQPLLQPFCSGII